MSLDHTAFPYIFDLIRSFAPYPAALRIRATCRANRDAFDKQHFQRVVVGIPVDAAGEQSAWMEMRCARAPYARLPLLPWGEEAETPESSASRKRMLAHVKRLDMHAAVDDARFLVGDARFQGLLPSLEAVRRRRYDKARPLNLRAATVVDYLEVTMAEDDEDHKPMCTLSLKSTAEHHILHIHYDAAHPYMSRALILLMLDDAPSLRSLDIVFHSNGAPPVPPNDPQMFYTPPCGMLGMLANNVREMIMQGGQVRIYGVEEMHPRILCEDESLTGQALVEQEVEPFMNEHLRNMIGRMSRQPDYVLKNPILFLNRDQANDGEDEDGLFAPRLPVVQPNNPYYTD